MTKLDDLDKKLDDMAESLAVVATRQEVNTQTIADLVICIKGSPENGKHPGHAGRILSLEQSRRATRWSLNAAWMLLVAIIAAGLGATLSGFFSGGG